MSQIYFTTLTAIGEAKHANAAVTGNKVEYATLEVGDGNGVVPVPDRNQTSLVNRVRSHGINTVMIDPDNPSQIIVEQVIPEDVGGWWIREVGIRDVAGDLIAVASVPPTYKPVLLEGSGRNQIIRVVLLLASTSVVELKIDPAIVVATRKYVDDLVTAPSGVEEGTYGSTSEYPVFTVDSRGRIVHAGTIETVSVWDDIPDQNIGDIIFVKGLGEMWWVDNEFLTGYRTKWCGIPAHTLDRANRSWTISLRGGTFDKSLKKYHGLYSWILENDLMVPAAEYEDGEGFFAELGGNIVKVPNFDDMFWRSIGTDRDTANATLLGGRKGDSLKNHIHGLITSGGTAGPGSAALPDHLFEAWSGNSNPGLAGISAAVTYGVGSAETAPKHTYLHPRLCI
ncbi:phage tail protein [Paracandidimonas soli]|uniref:Tail-collar fiber protein n=1 Tax=Paracandidimonas soli TaxID=1917182 RepID=A0A4R3V666_9BURK|nr:phage tail protein [Paracandidimonas soli]TCV00517.1 tail-collar fiber protein [Paracandidimonas soli]